MKLHLKMLSSKWQPFCLGPNGLMNNLNVFPETALHNSFTAHFRNFGISGSVCHKEFSVFYSYATYQTPDWLILWQIIGELVNHINSLAPERCGSTFTIFFQTHFMKRCLEHFFCNCPQVNVIRPHWWLVNIGSSNGLVPSRSLEQNGCHVADDIYEYIFLKDFVFWFEFHWRLFHEVQLTISQHLLR